LALGALGLLPLLADGRGEAGVERVPPGRTAMMCALRRTPGEDDVADDIEDLVADELVLETEGSLTILSPLRMIAESSVPPLMRPFSMRPSMSS
jgi:hypothetical protein